MKAIKCELCGSNKFTKVDGYFQCEYCGTKYSLEDAQKMIVSETVQVTKGEAEKRRLLSNVQTFIKLKNYNQAKDVIFKLSREFPDDYNIWVCFSKVIFYALLDSYYFIEGFSTGYMEEALNYLNYANNLNSSFDINLFCEKIREMHGENLVILNKTDEEHGKGSYKTIGLFDTDLICFSKDKLPIPFQELQIKLSQQYANELLKGNVLDFGDDGLWNVGYGWFPEKLPYDNKIMQQLYSMGKSNALKLENNPYKDLIKTKMGIYYDSLVFLIGRIAFTRNDGFLHIHVLEYIYDDSMIDPHSTFLQGLINEKKQRDNQKDTVKKEIFNLCKACLNKRELIEDLAKYNGQAIWLYSNDKSNIISVEKVEDNYISFILPNGMFAKEQRTLHIYIRNLDDMLIFLRKRFNRCVICGSRLNPFSKKCAKCGK